MEPVSVDDNESGSENHGHQNLTNLSFETQWSWLLFMFRQTLCNQTSPTYVSLFTMHGMAPNQPHKSTMYAVNIGPPLLLVEKYFLQYVTLLDLDLYYQIQRKCENGIGLVVDGVEFGVSDSASIVESLTKTPFFKNHYHQTQVYGAAAVTVVDRWRILVVNVKMVMVLKWEGDDWFLDMTVVIAGYCSRKWCLKCLIVRPVWDSLLSIGIFVREKMSQDVIMVGSTMRIPLLYRVSLAGTAQNAPPTLKDPKFWTAKEKKTRKIDHLARSLLIQGISNDIYSLIDSNKTAKDLWDALERQMRGSEYGEQDMKAAILYEYETFKPIEGEQLLDTYLQWKQYGTLMGQTKNLMDINIDALYNILNQNQGDVNDALRYKKKVVVVTSDPLALVVEKTKVSKRKEKVVVSSDSEGSGEDDFSELKKITALLANAFNRRKFYFKPTNNNLRTSSTSQSANKKQEFVKSDDKK
nr:hypothetical protein [Tanacetum cinerariifolium]